MTDEQFEHFMKSLAEAKKEFIEKMDEIVCGLVDVENEIAGMRREA